MLSILGFLVILGPLVVFHEFGHYIFARYFNVKAEVFSIGFGPRIWSKQLGETELRIAAIPLGGFVKLLGDEPDRELSPEEAKRSLSRQEPWKRFLIFFGGPLFNLILAVLVFMAILAIGEPQMASVLGRVVQGSYAEKSGFRSGDRVLSVDGKPVKRFEELLSSISEHPKQAMSFGLERAHGAGQETIQVAPEAQDGFSVYGEQTHVGEIEGLLPMARATHVGVSDPNSLAGKAGVHTGDKLVAMNGQPIASWEDLEYSYGRFSAQQLIRLRFEGSKPTDVHELTFAKSAGTQLTGATGTGSLGFTESTGVYSSELFVDKVVPASPAESSGLKSGDRLVGIGALNVKSFFELRDSVQRAGEKEGKVTVRWERGGKEMTATVTPTSTTVKDPVLKKSVQFTIGVVPQLVWAEPITITEQIWNPFTLFYKASERMVIFSYRNLVSIGKMFKGEVSIATLGGPILIGKIAGESLSRGLIAFLTTMAVLSVGLGVLNLLPIPVLDGGHLLLLAIEAIRGKPLSVRHMEIIQQVGLSLILLLMVIVMRNDLARLPFFE